MSHYSTMQKPIAGQAPLPDMECKTVIPAFVTKERRIKVPYAFSADQQGFTELGPMLQGRKGMVAACMPAVSEGNVIKQAIE